MVALGGDEDLGLVHETAEGLRVDDAVAVALKWRAEAARRFVAGAPAGLVRADGELGKGVPLLFADSRLEALCDRVGACGFGRSDGPSGQG